MDTNDTHFLRFFFFFCILFITFYKQINVFAIFRYGGGVFVVPSACVRVCIFSDRGQLVICCFFFSFCQCKYSLFVSFALPEKLLTDARAVDYIFTDRPHLNVPRLTVFRFVFHHNAVWPIHPNSAINTFKL